MHRAVHRCAALAPLAALLFAGCVDYLDSGEMGKPRYFGEVRGIAPLRMLPPISDREGNVYALYGDPDLNEAQAFVGHASGSWSDGCKLHKGDDRGAHGWVGRATSRAWYWSGDALVEVNGRSGNCTAVLDTDPSSGANLLFQGVVPMVNETPSRSTVPALIQTSVDSVPFHVLVDLDIGRYSETSPFEPAGASNVIVLGVGADRDSRTGFMLVRYDLDGQAVVEGLFLDDKGQVTDRAPVARASASAEDSVLGYLQSTDGERVVGLLETGEVVSFTRDGGSAEAFDAFTAAGVHVWEDQLYLVGTSGTTPVIAPILPDGSIGAHQTWEASVAAAEHLAGTVAVLDERSQPRQVVGWADPTSAIGPAPFISAHSPDVYADGTTGWLLAGPAFQQSTNPQTSVAFVPVGISYP